MADDAMGTLRGLLHEPDEHSWQTIIECLLQWPSDEELYEVALPYCHDMLKQWPEALPRIATLAMYHVFMGTRAPKTPTARTMAISSLSSTFIPPISWNKYQKNKPIKPIDLPPKQPRFWADTLHLRFHDDRTFTLDYLAQHDMPNLSKLSISMFYGTTPAAVEPLKDVQWLGTNIKGLAITMGGDALHAFLAYTDLSELEFLDISGAEGALSGKDLKALLDKTNADHLHTFDCADAWLSNDAGNVIAKHPALSNLTSFDIRYNMGLYQSIDAIQNSSTLSTIAKESIEDQYEDIFE